MKTLGRALHDITQLFESASGAEARVRKCLDLLKLLVPFDQCAVMEIGLPRIVAVPEATGEVRERLTGELLALFGSFVDGHTEERAPAGSAPRLAVPLVGLDEVIGILHVTSAAGFEEDHLRALSLVAGKLAAFFSMTRAQTELLAFARERDLAVREAEKATQEKDELLQLISRGLRMPSGAMLDSMRLLRTAKDDSERLVAIEQLERHVQMQASLIDDVLQIGARMPRTLPPPPAAGSFPPDASGGRLAGIRVLLVDHDPGLREAFQSALARYEADIETVADGPEALAALDRARPHVLLVGDLAARGASTADLIREITARACPFAVVSISAWRVGEPSVPGYRLHLRKPLEMETLVEAVESVVGRHSRD